MSDVPIHPAGYRRNVTLTTPPTPRQADALVRNGFTYDERARGRLVRDLPAGTFEHDARAVAIEINRPRVALAVAA